MVPAPVTTHVYCLGNLPRDDRARHVHVRAFFTAAAVVLCLSDGLAVHGPQERVMAFGNVELNQSGEESKNAAEMVVARGFASVVRHRSDEERSSVYEKLMELEEMAKKAKKGIHSTKEAPPTRVNDVSLPGNSARAKQYLPFFQRSGRMQVSCFMCLTVFALCVGL